MEFKNNTMDWTLSTKTWS